MQAWLAIQALAARSTPLAARSLDSSGRTKEIINSPNNLSHFATSLIQSPCSLQAKLRMHWKQGRGRRGWIRILYDGTDNIQGRLIFS
jgi:hypothetical protein